MKPTSHGVLLIQLVILQAAAEMSSNVTSIGFGHSPDIVNLRILERILFEIGTFGGIPFSFVSFSSRSIILYFLCYVLIFFLTAQKLKFSIKDFFSKCDQIRKKLRIWSHLLKKSLMEHFIFCAVPKTLRHFCNNFYDSLLNRVSLHLIYIFNLHPKFTW